MIKSIHLRGFKSFLDRELNFGRLTVLTGLNSSGKSSIIQALLMLEKAYNGDKSVLLPNHGTAKELQNINTSDKIYLGIELDSGDFSVEIPVADDGDAYQVIERPERGGYPEMHYISADRFGPRSTISIYNDSNLVNKIGPNGENLLQAISFYEYQALNPLVVNEHAESDQLIFNIRAWLNKISPNTHFSYELVKQSDTSYSIFNKFRAANVGFGLSYILPVISVLLISTIVPGSVVIIENPEAHLHPKGQTEIAKLIALCCKAGTQVIIETHSDHVFDGIRIAVKDFGDFSEQVQLHWFELDEYQLTDVTSPIIDNDGRLNEWPKNFFDQFEINSSKLI